MKGCKARRVGRYFDSWVKTLDNPSIANGYGSLQEGDQADQLYGDLVNEITECVEISKEHTLLDVGCGTGELLRRLLNHVSSGVGLEISEEMAKVAIAKDLNVSIYDGYTFPFGSESFDLVIIFSVFINLQNEKIATRLIEESHRVLKPGGKLLIGLVPHPRLSGFPTHRRRDLKMLKIKAHEAMGGITYYAYDYEFFLDIYESLGFSSILFKRCGIRRPGFASKYHVIMEY